MRQIWTTIFNGQAQIFDFRRNRNSRNDVLHLRKPLKAITTEFIAKILEILLGNRKIKWSELGYHWYLKEMHRFYPLRKLCVRWVSVLVLILHLILSINWMTCFMNTASVRFSPSDYFFFPRLKKWFGGKRFDSNEVKLETNTYFEGFEFLYSPTYKEY